MSAGARSAAALVCVLGVLGASTAPAAAAVQATAVHDEGPVEQQEEPSRSILADSVARYDVEASVATYDREQSIDELGDGTEEDQEDVVVLEADILFSSHEWDLPANIGSRLAELVEDVPEGASVRVHGHTDSRPVDESQYDFDNQELSENRAQAVANALAEERPDIDMTVEGFGDSQLAVTEDPDDPDTYAANRRVEIRYD